MPHAFHTVANLSHYCSMLQKIYHIPHLLNGLKLGLVWDMCQIFSIWHISHIYCGCSNKSYILLVAMALKIELDQPIQPVQLEIEYQSGLIKMLKIEKNWELEANLVLPSIQFLKHLVFYCQILLFLNPIIIIIIINQVFFFLNPPITFMVNQFFLIM